MLKRLSEALCHAASATGFITEIILHLDYDIGVADPSCEFEETGGNPDTRPNIGGMRTPILIDLRSSLPLMVISSGVTAYSVLSP
jgi:hypothetical protein